MISSNFHSRRDLMQIGIIGAESIGGTLTRKLVAVPHAVPHAVKLAGKRLGENSGERRVDLLR